MSKVFALRKLINDKRLYDCFADQTRQNSRFPKVDFQKQGFSTSKMLRFTPKT